MGKAISSCSFLWGTKNTVSTTVEPEPEASNGHSKRPSRVNEVQHQNQRRALKPLSMEGPNSDASGRVPLGSWDFWPQAPTSRRKNQNRPTLGLTPPRGSTPWRGGPCLRHLGHGLRRFPSIWALCVEARLPLLVSFQRDSKRKTAMLGRPIAKIMHPFRVQLLWSTVQGIAPQGLLGSCTLLGCLNRLTRIRPLETMAATYLPDVAWSAPCATRLGDLRESHFSGSHGESALFCLLKDNTQTWKPAILREPLF